MQQNLQSFEIKTYKFLQPAFNSKKKYVIIRAGRRVGKTYSAVQKICIYMLKNKQAKGLWVDTIQSNLSNYIERYFQPILGPLWSRQIKINGQNKNMIVYDKQKLMIKFYSNDGTFSYIDFRSAEKPEHLEGFEYDITILNEAGIILKKSGLWDKSIMPMVKNGQVFFVGTPKGKTGHKYYELSQLCKTNKDWEEYHFPSICSPRYTLQEIEDIKSVIPPYEFVQEYEAEFVDLYENSILTPDMICYYDTVDINDFDEIFVHGDLTHTTKTTSDFFALLAVGQNKVDKKYYILDFILDKIDAELQSESFIAFYQRYGDKIKNMSFDEKSNNAFGEWTKKLAREKYNISLPLTELRYPQDKVTHFSPHFRHFKAKNVLLPKNHPRISIAVAQLLAFPTKNVKDDFVDGISGAMDNFIQKNTPHTGIFIG